MLLYLAITQVDLCQCVAPQQDARQPLQPFTCRVPSLGQCSTALARALQPDRSRADEAGGLQRRRTAALCRKTGPG